jgi:hypothetical protein
MGWRVKDTCAADESQVKTAIESLFPMIGGPASGTNTTGATYYADAELLSLVPQSNGTAYIDFGAMAKDSAGQSLGQDRFKMTLPYCEVSAGEVALSESLFGELALQDAVIWLALAFAFVIGFSAGNR